jgi:hypothetical protein
MPSCCSWARICCQSSPLSAAAISSQSATRPPPGCGPSSAGGRSRLRRPARVPAGRRSSSSERRESSRRRPTGPRRGATPRAHGAGRVRAAAARADGPGPCPGEHGLVADGRLQKHCRGENIRHQCLGHIAPGKLATGAQRNAEYVLVVGFQLKPLRSWKGWSRMRSARRARQRFLGDCVQHGPMSLRPLLRGPVHGESHSGT